MTNNDILRRIRYVFDFGDDEMIALFALIYRLVPFVMPPPGAVIPGALVAATLVYLAKSGFVYYLVNVAHFESVYGTLSSVIVLLTWLFCVALALIIGVEFNVARARVRGLRPSDSQA